MNINEIFLRQKAAFHKKPLSHVSERIDDLLKLKSIISENKIALFNAVNMDFQGRNIEEVFISELIPIQKSIQYIIKNLSQWMSDSPRQADSHFGKLEASVNYQPLGVVGISSPWNYPVYLTLSPLIYALCAGNYAMLRVSEFTPNTASLLSMLLHSNYTNDKINVLSGDKVSIIDFSKIPFDHLFFTGSTAVGKMVMKNAADNLTPVTLELGGKSPGIITQSCDLTSSIAKIVYAKTMNSGQTCVAPDYLFVPESMIGSVTDNVCSAFDDFYPQFEKNDQYGSLISATHYQRFLEYIEDAKKYGAEILILGGHGSLLSQRKKMPLILIIPAHHDMQVMQEEIFGPILPVVTYKSFDEIIRHLQHERLSLAIYYFGNDVSQINLLKSDTQSGALCINDAIIQLMIDDLPFGGVGHSGFGRYHAKEGFLTFSNPRSIITNLGDGRERRLMPPYCGTAVKYFDKLT